MAAADTKTSNISGAGTKSGSGNTQQSNKKVVNEYKPGMITKFLNVLGGALSEKSDKAAKSKAWIFCPPSDNLWTVEFKVHSDGYANNGANNISQLVKNINMALGNFNSMYFNGYKVTPQEDTGNQFYSIICDNELKMFLANDININTNTISVDDSSAASLNSHGGFITSGKLITARGHGLQCNIKFIQSNYSVIDLVFDKWIAALACQGLIQDSSLPELRSDIIMYNYSAGHPVDSEKNPGTWKLRKKVVVYKAFPISKGPIKGSYEPGQAGVYKEDIVAFKFSDYSIEYLV